MNRKAILVASVIAQRKSCPNDTDSDKSPQAMSDKRNIYLQEIVK